MTRVAFSAIVRAPETQYIRHALNCIVRKHKSLLIARRRRSKGKNVFVRRVENRENTL